MALHAVGGLGVGSLPTFFSFVLISCLFVAGCACPLPPASLPLPPGRARFVPPCISRHTDHLLIYWYFSIYDCLLADWLWWTTDENIIYIILCCPLRVDNHPPPFCMYTITLSRIREISLQGPISTQANVLLLFYAPCLLPAIHPYTKHLYYLV